MYIRELKSKREDDPAGLTESSKFFYLNIEHSEFLETLKRNDELQVYSFFIAVTILHEFVHVGRRANDLRKYDTNEMGWGWEEATFGGHIINGALKDIPNFGNFFSENKALVKKYKWSFKDEKYKYPPLF